MVDCRIRYREFDRKPAIGRGLVEIGAMVEPQPWQTWGLG